MKNAPPHVTQLLPIAAVLGVVELLAGGLRKFLSEASRHGSSFAVVLIGHYGYVGLCRALGVENLSVSATLVLAYAYFLAVYWGMSLLFCGLDRHAAQRGSVSRKIVSKKQDLSFWKLSPSVLVNHALLVVMAAPLLVLSGAVTQEPPSLGRSLWGIVVIIIGYDAVLYAGHRLMHSGPRILKGFHHQHHRTHALRAVSAHYMHGFDFALEVVLPAALPMALLGVSGPALVAFVGLGAWNGVIVHSGWELPLCPSPRGHFDHHLKMKGHYGLGLFDWALKTGP
jgi:sterol desaturase/sphingolipid hydroxylase (fatty acid hydroxylase superfamily)